MDTEKEESRSQSVESGDCSQESYSPASGKLVMVSFSDFFCFFFLFFFLFFSQFSQTSYPASRRPRALQGTSMRRWGTREGGIARLSN